MIPKQRKIRKNYMNKVAINFINEFGPVRLTPYPAGSACFSVETVFFSHKNSARTVVCRVFFIAHSAIVCRVSINTRQKETLGTKIITGWHGDGDFAECPTENTR